MYQAAGAAAQILGQILKGIAANQAKHAMEKAFKGELTRQRGYRNEAFGVFEGAVPKYGVETAREEMGRGQEHREGLYNQVGATDFTASQPSGFGATGADQANLAMAGQARGKLGSYSDWQLDQMIRSIRTQDELNKINNFASGTAGVFPYRMYDAQHSGDSLAFAGDLLSSIGGLASGMGGLNFGGGGSGGVGGGSLEMLDAPSGYENMFAGIV